MYEQNSSENNNNNNLLNLEMSEHFFFFSYFFAKILNYSIYLKIILCVFAKIKSFHLRNMTLDSSSIC